MKNLLYTCLSQKDKIYIDTLEMFITEGQNIERNYRTGTIVSDDELQMIGFLISSWEAAGITPDDNIFMGHFPKTQGWLNPVAKQNLTLLTLDNLRSYMFDLIDVRVNSYINKTLVALNAKVAAHGITQDIADEFTRLQRLSNRNKSKHIDVNISGKDNYDILRKRAIGMQTGIKAIDDRIGGMNPGTVTTIAGFTSQYKTTFSANIAELNSYHFGYNIAYISLETPKEDMYWNFLSCHSYNTEFPQFTFVSHDKMRKCKMTPEEEKFIFETVEPSFDSFIQLPDGKQERRGKVVFLDESDFNTFSFGEITAVLEEVDDKLKAETGSRLDAVIVDYIQLCKFSGDGMTYDANSQINSYVTFFRRLSQNFRKEVDPNTGAEKVRSLIMILLSQINRDNWRRARNNEGRYDITCLADANELERGSHRVFTTYTTEEMKARKTAQVQILKNRTGQTMYDPVPVYADGEAYVFLDEETMGQTLGGAMAQADGQSAIDAAFGMMGDSDLESLLSGF